MHGQQNIKIWYMRSCPCTRFLNLQRRGLQLHSLHPQHQLDMSGQLYTPASLISRIGPDFNRRRYCLGPAPNLDTLKKRKFLLPAIAALFFGFPQFTCALIHFLYIKERLCLFLSQKMVKKVIRQQLFQENTAFDSLVTRLCRVHCPKPKAIIIMKPNQTDTLRCTDTAVSVAGERAHAHYRRHCFFKVQLIQIPCGTSVLSCL